MCAGKCVGHLCMLAHAYALHRELWTRWSVFAFSGCQLAGDAWSAGACQGYRGPSSARSFSPHIWWAKAVDCGTRECTTWCHLVPQWDTGQRTHRTLRPSALPTTFRTSQRAELVHARKAATRPEQHHPTHVPRAVGNSCADRNACATRSAQVTRLVHLPSNTPRPEWHVMKSL